MKGQRFADGLAFGVAVLHEAPVAPEKLLAHIARGDAPDPLRARVRTLAGENREIGYCFESA